jgi:phosphohistidine phosphatase
MRTLYLLRHAKPVSPDRNQNDFDRHLIEAGRSQAEKIGKVIGDEHLTAAMVISSPAVRARETIELVLSSARLPLTPTFESRIYDATLATLMDVIESSEDTNQVLLLVGHNPGMESLLRFFTREVHSMPTAGLAKIVFESDSWKDLSNGEARLDWLISP